MTSNNFEREVQIALHRAVQDDPVHIDELVQNLRTLDQFGSIPEREFCRISLIRHIRLGLFQKALDDARRLEVEHGMHPDDIMTDARSAASVSSNEVFEFISRYETKPAEKKPFFLARIPVSIWAAFVVLLACGGLLAAIILWQQDSPNEEAVPSETVYVQDEMEENPGNEMIAHESAGVTEVVPTLPQPDDSQDAEPAQLDEQEPGLSPSLPNQSACLRQLVEINFVDRPLIDVLDYLKAVTGCAITTDWALLEQNCGVTDLDLFNHEEVTVSLEDALNLILNQVDLGTECLQWDLLAGGTILITAPEAVEFPDTPLDDKDSSLDQVVAADFDQSALGNVLEFLAASIDGSMQVDWTSLDIHCGVTDETLITIQEELPFSDVIDEVLARAAPGDCSTWEQLDDGTIFITAAVILDGAGISGTSGQGSSKSNRSQPANRTPADIAGDSVVRVDIEIHLPNGPEYQPDLRWAPAGGGSGLAISPNHILTNWHVVCKTQGKNSNGTDCEGYYRAVVIPSRVNAREIVLDQDAVVYRGPGKHDDFAILEVPGHGLAPLVMRGVPGIGHEVSALGFPGVANDYLELKMDQQRQIERDEKLGNLDPDGSYNLLVYHTDLGMEPNLRNGVVSQRDSGSGYMQADVHIARGNSGGPLVDKAGKVVAITTSFILGSENAYGFLTIQHIMKYCPQYFTHKIPAPGP